LASSRNGTQKNINADSGFFGLFGSRWGLSVFGEVDFFACEKEIANQSRAGQDSIWSGTEAESEYATTTNQPAAEKSQRHSQPTPHDEEETKDGRQQNSLGRRKRQRGEQTTESLARLAALYSSTASLCSGFSSKYAAIFNSYSVFSALAAAFCVALSASERAFHSALPSCIQVLGSEPPVACLVFSA
jgi:cystathionine beta-lyase/cystathionine gamma-synthase